MIELVERALYGAWETVVRDHHAVVIAADEDQITEKLKTVMVAMRKRNEPPGFSDALFGVPSRDSRLADWSGKSIDQSPDLTIYAANSRRDVSDDQYDALFMECKVLDATRGLNLYNTRGMRRFIDGSYAWRMPHALMIAYVLDDDERTPFASLTAYFAEVPRNAVGSTKNSATKKSIGSLLATRGNPTVVMSSMGPLAADVVLTAHERSAPLSGSVPNVIELRHLWMRALRCRHGRDIDIAALTE